MAIATSQAPSVNGAPTSAGKILITAISDKGGISKSPLLHIVTEKLLERERRLPADEQGKLHIVDADASTGSLSMYYARHKRADGNRLVDRFSFHSGRFGIDELVTDHLQRGADRVVVDLPASSLLRFREMAEEYNFLDAVTHAGYRLVLLCPIFPLRQTLFDLEGVIEMFDPEIFAAFATAVRGNRKLPPPRPRQPLVSYVSALNMNAPAVEDRGDFDKWDAELDLTESDPLTGDPLGFTRALFQYSGGRQLVIPKLRARIQGYLEDTTLSFAEAAVKPGLEFPDRSRLETWVKKVDTELAGVSDVLGL